MKKLVMFTLVLVVCLSGSAFALLNDNAVAVDDGSSRIRQWRQCRCVQKPRLLRLGAQSATTGGTNVMQTLMWTCSKNVATKGSQAATNGGLLSVDDTLNNMRYKAAIVDRDNNPNNRSSTDNRGYNIVDNAILANVNVKDDSFLGPQTGTITFIKSQHAEIDGSFNRATGVSNINSAAGNFNTQTAATVISVDFGGRR